MEISKYTVPGLPNVIWKDLTLQTAMISLGAVEKYTSILGSKSKQVLTPDQSIEFDISTNFVKEIMDDLLVHNWHAVLDGVNYITNRVIDENLFSKVNSPSEIESNKSIKEALSHQLPTVSTPSLDKLIKLRNEEGESFEVYRDALTEILGKNRNLSVSELPEAFQDMVQPELNKIELTIRNSKKVLTDSIR